MQVANARGVVARVKRGECSGKITGRAALESPPQWFHRSEWRRRAAKLVERCSCATMLLRLDIQAPAWGDGREQEPGTRIVIAQLVRQRANERHVPHYFSRPRQVFADMQAGDGRRNRFELAAHLTGASGLRSNVSR
jgi:hypothetical protein